LGGWAGGLQGVKCHKYVDVQNAFPDAERTARIVQALFSPGGPQFGLVPQSLSLSTLTHVGGTQ
jgi:hypothetical protein